MAPPPARHGEDVPARPARDPGDAWVEGPTGERFWGRFGAAGLLVHDPAQGVLLQHRAAWSHHGGTWGIPGGALQEGETPIAAALREANEEAGVPPNAVRVHGTRVIDREVWRYTTLITEATTPFTPVVGDAESVELAWVALGQVTDLPLHPAFGQAWPVLSRLLKMRPFTVVVDAANAVGSEPNGWWRDRRGATERLMGRLTALGETGLPADQLALDASTWHPRIDVIVEGQARDASAAATTTPGALTQVNVVPAPGLGDDTIVEQTQQRINDGSQVIVVTSDRELRERVAALGAQYRGVKWLLDMLPN